MLNNIQKSGKLPHLLLYGPAGTGKTSTILAFARQVFGAEALGSRILELNASDERGIDMIRDRVKAWSRLLTAPVTLKLDAAEGKIVSQNATVCPPWKIILLDEADMMTGDAQSALRRVMEDTTRHTRFVLICNYLSKIIAPISSRCVRIRFQPIPLEAQLERLKSIAVAEKLSITDGALAEIGRLARGDLRYAINLLQSTAAGHLGAGVVDEEAVIAAAGHPPREVASGLLKLCKDKVALSVLLDSVKKVAHDGWDLHILLRQVTECMVGDPELSDAQRAKIAFAVSLAEQRLLEGGLEVLQLTQAIVECHAAL